jgi:hypothetical protein
VVNSGGVRIQASRFQDIHHAGDARAGGWTYEDLIGTAMGSHGENVMFGGGDYRYIHPQDIIIRRCHWTKSHYGSPTALIGEPVGTEERQARPD